jgi:hypothetical protein
MLADILEQGPEGGPLYGASTADRQLLGDAPGQQTHKLAHAVREVAKPNYALAEVGGVNVHAGTAVPSRDRQRLERLSRYVARPPIAQDRLELTADGRCRYDFRHAWKNGVHVVVLDPLDFIARLCALIPPPRFHMLRYHGVLAAHAKARPEVVPGPVSVPTEPMQMPLSLDSAAAELDTCLLSVAQLELLGAAEADWATRVTERTADS